MVEVKFFRDEKYVYFNNPNGITTKKSIADFEKWISGEGGGSGGGLIVDIDVSPGETPDDELTVISRSATYSEIKAAIANGINVSVRYTVLGSKTGGFLHLYKFNTGEDAEYIEFIGYNLTRRGSGPLNITTHSYYVDPIGDAYTETLFRVTIAE